MNTYTLKTMLDVEYTKLGFTLNRIRVVISGGFYYIQGEFRCPCGATECFSMKLHKNTEIAVPQIVSNILRNTASIEHIRKDVLEGKLPESALMCNTYREDHGQ